MEIETRQQMKPYGQHSTMNMPTMSGLTLSEHMVPTPEMAQQIQEYNSRVQLVLQGFQGHVMPMPMPISYPTSILPVPHPLQAGFPRPGFPASFLCREEPKPQYSYIGLIAMAILSSKEKRLVLSDIYQWILDNYIYFRQRGPGWRNSIRHNLSLNDCFIKADRSANGKGHYWAIHDANLEDFKKGDFRRRRAQNRVRKAMGLDITDNDDDDSPCPSPVVRLPVISWQGSGKQRTGSPPETSVCTPGPSFEASNMYNNDPKSTNMYPSNPTSTKDISSVQSSDLANPSCPAMYNFKPIEHADMFTSMSHKPRFYPQPVMPHLQSSAISQDRPRKKRAFDVESLLAPDDIYEAQTPKRQCQGNN
ncbi:unnamed protein product [Owenia fusiformis]|uniref:Uncharacterized protein n=1 Tax=Owenia fusiformis TaxID=6347 RepID=A0A8J1TWJ6_OWEFU|nr:unnamed protein product [Owenia fusiformis]